MSSTDDVRSQMIGLFRQVADKDLELDDSRRSAGRDADRLLVYLFELADAVDRIIDAQTPKSSDLLVALRRQLEEYIGSEGVVAVRPMVGEAPNLSHVQVISTKSESGLRSGVVTRVFHDGYVRDGRVLRRAGVEISKG